MPATGAEPPGPTGAGEYSGGEIYRLRMLLYLYPLQQSTATPRKSVGEAHVPQANHRCRIEFDDDGIDATLTKCIHHTKPGRARSDHDDVIMQLRRRLLIRRRLRVVLLLGGAQSEGHTKGTCRPK